MPVKLLLGTIFSFMFGCVSVDSELWDQCQDKCYTHGDLEQVSKDWINGRSCECKDGEQIYLDVPKHSNTRKPRQSYSY